MPKLKQFNEKEFNINVGGKKIILADEPTGNLDPGTSKEIMNLLLKINKQGSTILMATHDYDMISLFPKRTLRLEDGKLYELTKKT